MFTANEKKKKNERKKKEETKLDKKKITKKKRILRELMDSHGKDRKEAI